MIHFSEIIVVLKIISWIGIYKYQACCSLSTTLVQIKVSQKLLHALLFILVQILTVPELGDW